MNLEVYLQIGDTVRKRNWGGTVSEAKIVEMEVTDGPREKEGIPVDFVTKNFVDQNRVVFVLDNGTWAYAEQITKV